MLLYREYKNVRSATAPPPLLPAHIETMPSPFPLSYLFFSLQSKNMIACIHWEGWGESTEQTECQAFSPVVLIGSAHLLTRMRVLLCPLVPGGTHSLAGEGVGGPNSDDRSAPGQTLWYSRYNTTMGERVGTTPKKSMVFGYSLLLFQDRGLLTHTSPFLFLIH